MKILVAYLCVILVCLSLSQANLAKFGKNGKIRDPKALWDEFHRRNSITKNQNLPKITENDGNLSKSVENDEKSILMRNLARRLVRKRLKMAMKEKLREQVILQRNNQSNLFSKTFRVKQKLLFSRHTINPYTQR